MTAPLDVNPFDDGDDAPLVDLDVEVPKFGARAEGTVTVVRRSDGAVVHAHRGDWNRSGTRDRFCRDVAAELYPHAPDGDAGGTARLRAEAALLLKGQLLAVLARLRADRAKREAEVRADPLPAPAADDDAPQYVLTDFGICRRRATPDGAVVNAPLTNFKAFIVDDQTRDDGVEPEHVFVVKAKVCSPNATHRTFPVPAKHFASMNWVADHLGAAAVVHAGSSTKDHARAAIQILSGEIPMSTTYTHLGWRNLGDKAWAYLSAGGAIGATGLVPGVDVELSGTLAHFRLPEPPGGDALVAAVRASLAFVGLARPAITLPVYAAVWRSLLGRCDSSIHLSGASGVFKTELAALVQQHFGPELGARRLPASWTATENYLEGLCNTAKDGLVVIDELTPRGTAADVSGYMRKVDRVLRGIGNSVGRGRMAADGKLRPERPPRCMVLSTGEENPTGQSLKARLFIVELAKGDVDAAVLTKCQADAAGGLYAQATAGFLRWVAGRYGELSAGLKAELAEFRERASKRDTPHARTPEVVANLMVGFRHFVRFAVDCGAVSQDVGIGLLREAWAAITAAADAQAVHQASDEPTARALQLLTAAVASGAAHLADPDGSAPPNPAAWGWRSRVVSNGVTNRADWEPEGARVGWVDGDEVCLEPEAFYVAVQRAGGSNGLAVTATVLRKRMAEKDLLARVDSKRGTLMVRRTLQGERRETLILKPGVFGPTGQNDAGAELDPSLFPSAAAD